MFEKYVDGYAAIAFPPPHIGQFQKQSFLFCFHNAAKVVDGGDKVVSILYDTHILVSSISAKSYKWVLVGQLGKDIWVH